MQGAGRSAPTREAGKIANVNGFVFPNPVAGCTPNVTDSCGTMLPGRLGIQPVSVGDNAVVQLTR